MARVPRTAAVVAPTAVSPPPGLAPSADGGVLLLARAWTALGGAAIAAAGVRWRGVGAELLLVALVVVPVLGAASVQAVAARTGVTADALWGALGWSAVLSQRRLARFAASGRHDWVAVLGAMAGALAHCAGLAVGDDGVIVVDSTTVEKRHGRRMAGRRPVYDSIRKRLVDGYELVSGVVAGPGGSWPLGLLPHRKADTVPERDAVKRRRRKARPGEAPSKLDLALTLVGLAITAGVGAPTVVGDAAFAVNWWLREIAALGRHWLVGTRRDRRLRIGALIQPFHAWASAAPLSELARMPDGSSLWGVVLAEAILPDRHCTRRGLACRPAYVERRARGGRVTHRWYLLTSQLDWDLATLWQHWSWRWPIEVFHRTAKQQLHLTAFHARTWEAIVAWVACASLRASVLAAVQALDPTCRPLSTETLVHCLAHAAALVQTGPDDTVAVHPPPTLPATVLWRHPAPNPAWWPPNLRAA